MSQAQVILIIIQALTLVPQFTTNIQQKQSKHPLTSLQNSIPEKRSEHQRSNLFNLDPTQKYASEIAGTFTIEDISIKHFTIPEPNT